MKKHETVYIQTPDSRLPMFFPPITDFRPLDARADLFAD